MPINMVKMESFWCLSWSDQESLVIWLKQNCETDERGSFEFIFNFCPYIFFTDHKRIVSTDSSVTYQVSNPSQALRKQDKDSLSP